MKFHLPIALATALTVTGAATARAQLSFSGNPLPVITDTPEASTGLKAIYVLHDLLGVKASYTAASPSSQITWKRFSQLGGGFAEDIPFTRQGNVSTVNLTSDDMGLIVEEDGRQTCYYVVNYANHPCSLSALDIAPERDCTYTALTLHGSAPRINYYTVAGAARELSRELLLEYNTLVYSADQQRYLQQTTALNLPSVNGAIHCTAPLCDTEFHLSGDRFLQKWGMEQHAVSPYVQPMAIAVTTSAEQASRENDNEQREENAESFGGSGPVEITFRAAVTDAVVFREWQFSRDPEFDIIDLRIQENEIEHEFSDYGTVYVRFVAGNDSGSCDFTSETYTVYIGESRLDCPNAFSPGATEGTNDEWKVSYKSIVSFDCSIFNRWGLQMCHFTDPSQGWDGKYKGKLVPPGVYYYVIRAKGTDGKEYKLSGDINILKFTDNRTSTTPTN